MDLTTNGVVIIDAIKFVQQNSKEKLKSPEKKKRTTIITKNQRNMMMVMEMIKILL
jgi:hypothetical protein